MSLHTDFEAVGLETIRAYVDAGREEDLYLDFKNVADPRLQREDRKTFAVALSGFANSDGGLIVWGVDARPNPQGVDCAVALNEISDVQLSLTRLNELTGQCVSPLVDGVIHKAVPSTGAAGFCVTLIPPSESGPHMAKGGEDRYFKRAGSAFYRLEHFDVADMFGRRHRPKLVLTLQKEGHGQSVLVFVKNEGRGIAKAPYLALDLPAGFRASGYGFDGNGRFGLRPIGQLGDRCFFGGDAGTVVHIGQELPVTRLDTTVQTVDGKPGLSGRRRFSYQLAAEDIEVTAGTFDLEY